MIRYSCLAVALLFPSAAPLHLQVIADDAVSDHASVLATAYAALQRGDPGAARAALATANNALRGTPFRLLEHLAAQEDPSKVLTGNAVPKPDTSFLLAVLDPTRPSAAYLCDQGIIQLYDLAQPDRAPRTIVSSRRKPLRYGSFSEDGRSFAAGDAEGGVLIWETGSWQEKASYVAGTGPVRSVSINKDGARLLAETERGVVFWDVGGGQEDGTVVADRYNFGTALCFSSDQRHFATGGLYSILIHDADNGKEVRRISHDPYTMHLCFSPDGRHIASGLRGSLNKWLGVFDVATGRKVFDRARHTKGITGLVFVDDGKCLLSTAADGTMKFWHVPSGTELLAMKLADSIYQPFTTLDGSTILWNQRGGPRYFLLK